MSDQGTQAVPVFAPRKLVVCCDGTWNEPYQIGNPTNVVKMVRAVLPKDVNEVTQLVYYHAGVGTGNIVDRFIGGTLGVGLAKNVQSAYDFLASNYVNGDKIYLFGFSRGAYTARALAGLIGKVGGLLPKGEMDLFPYVWDIYRDKVHRDALGTKNATKIEAAVRAVRFTQELGKNFRRLIDALSAAQPAPIFFIGVWDTVGALGVPGGGLRTIGQSLYDFHDTELSERVRYAYHALAIDERRKDFEPTLWTRPKGRATLPKAQPQTLEQVWFAGVHSNVGGGYPDCGLSDIAFLWMVDKAKEAQGRDPAYLPLAFDEGYLKDKTDQAMGLLENSGRKIFWKWLGLRDRAVMAPLPPDPATGKERETCEYIHWSAWFRLQCTGTDQFAPFPYAPDNLRDAVKRNAGAVTKLSSLERRYRKWPEDVNPPAPPTA